MGCAALPAGSYELAATVRFGNGETQKDGFTIHVLPHPADVAGTAKIALLDPKGETGKLLSALLKFEFPENEPAELELALPGRT